MKLKFPSAQTILFLIAGLVALLTWIVPAGKFHQLSYDSTDKVFQLTTKDGTKSLPATQQVLDDLKISISIDKFTEGKIKKPVGVPNTYYKVQSTPQHFSDFLKSPIEGIIAAADIIFLVLIIGGLIGIMNHTGAFNSGISWLSKALRGREFLLIIIVTTLIALGGTTFGLAEETIAFFPILIPVFIVAGYDAMVGLACIFLGSAVGTMCSTINPFSAIIASSSAGIDWTTGLTGRLIMLLICLSITIIYIMRYAERVRKNPSKSVIFDQKETLEKYFNINESNGTNDFNWRIRLILLIFSLSFIIMIIGVSMLDWWFVEMTTTFLIASILIAIIGRIKESIFLSEFMKGAGDLLGVAFIIGIARGVSVLMDNGQISDTMLFYASTFTEGMSKGVFINVLTLIYSILSFFISSSSGMAVLTMPIMAPLADGVGIGRELVVNAYQYGMGLFYFINPTGLILASLAIVKIGFDRWLKFVMPLFILLICVTIIVLSTSVYL